MKIKPLLKQEIIDTIEGKNPSRVPSLFNIWPPPIYKLRNLIRCLRALKKYPSDISVYYSFSYVKTSIHGNNVIIFDKKKGKGALDSSIELPDYADLDKFLDSKFKDPNKMLFQPVMKSKKYRLGIFWNCLFENLWQIRGMENALMDVYLYPDEVHKIFRKITDFYKVLIVRAKKEAKCDGFFVSDDLGHQTSTFFSVEIFKEFFYPYYKELIDLAHENGMHFWLHTCGNIENYLPLYVELGLDVIHPIQKYTMDEVKIFEQYKNKITFLYGFDVQQTIPYGSAQDVRDEVHRAYDIFSKANGRFLFTQGNAISTNCPIESFEALVSESKFYNPYKK